MSSSNRIYQGKGVKLADRGMDPPLAPDNSGLFSADGYQPDDPLVDAVHVALTLGMPLLVTGEAGCGKTQLAASVAWELGLELKTFSTKSTSTYGDLWYRYDSLRHFGDIQLKRPEQPPQHYIEYGALGQAVWDAQLYNRRSVVLVDEIDKAPRDFPNDMLDEMERMRFTVRETREEFKAPSEYRPIVILTSNVERDLPDAFRRRCVFHHLAFPKPERLESIVAKRLWPNGDMGQFSEAMLKRAVERFMEIREKGGLDKKPSTAELIAWVQVLDRMEIDIDDPQSRDAVACSYSALAKSAEDLGRLR